MRLAGDGLHQRKATCTSGWYYLSLHEYSHSSGDSFPRNTVDAIAKFPDELQLDDFNLFFFWILIWKEEYCTVHDLPARNLAENETTRCVKPYNFGIASEPVERALRTLRRTWNRFPSLTALVVVPDNVNMTKFLLLAACPAPESALYV